MSKSRSKNCILCATLSQQTMIEWERSCFIIKIKLIRHSNFTASLICSYIFQYSLWDCIRIIPIFLSYIPEITLFFMTKFYKFYLIDISKSSTIYHAYPMESLSAIVCVNKEMIKLKMQHYHQLIPVLLIKISKNSIASIPI